MNFIQAIQSGFRHYVDFNGRASRSEYWYWMLFTTLVQIVADILGGSEQSPVALVVTLVLLLPSLAVGARRLHDIDRTGWWQLLWLVPLIGWIVLIVWACTKGTTGENRFGGDPLGPPDSAAVTSRA